MTPYNTLLAKISLFCLQIFIRLYPRSFRRTYGQEMVQVFRTSYTATYQQSGVWGVVRLWGTTAWDMLVGAVVERGMSMHKMVIFRIIAVGIWGSSVLWALSSLVIAVGPAPQFSNLQPYQLMSMLYYLSFLAGLVVLQLRQSRCLDWITWGLFGLVIFSMGGWLWLFVFPFVSVSGKTFMMQWIAWALGPSLVLWGIACLFRRTVSPWVAINLTLLGICTLARSLAMIFMSYSLNPPPEVLIPVGIFGLCQPLFFFLLGFAIWSPKAPSPEHGHTFAFQEINERR
jgi:hypothetical protein